VRLAQDISAGCRDGCPQPQRFGSARGDPRPYTRARRNLRNEVEALRRLREVRSALGIDPPADQMRAVQP